MSRGSKKRRGEGGANNAKEIERRRNRRLVGFLLLPILPFPLLSLITYSWKDISWLNAPTPEEPANVIGVAGAWSVFIGYSIMGLAFWLVPLVIMTFCIMLIYGRAARLWRRLFWIILLLAGIASLVQLTSEWPVVNSIMERLNIRPNAGGLIGYMVMTRWLARWFSPVGAGLVMLSVTLFALVMAVGIGTLFTSLGRLTGWWSVRQEERARSRIEAEKRRERDSAAADRKEQESLAKQKARESAKQVRAAARQAREAERQRIREERKAAAEARSAARREREQGEAPGKAVTSAKRQRSGTGTAKVPPVASSKTPATKGAVVEPKRAIYRLPPVALLEPVPLSTADPGNVSEMAETMVETLQEFDVPVQVIGTTPGPVVTQYELRPAPSIKVERIAKLSANLQMALEAKSLRVQAPIPGKNAVGIEVPNRKARPVTFREVVEGDAWRSCEHDIPLVLGKDVAGNDLIIDLATAPHLLVAGATGSGKSVCLNAIMTGLLMSRTPEELRLILVDPKRVEFVSYNELPHLLVPIIFEPKKVAFGLQWALVEMDRRYKLLQKTHSRSIKDFNSRVVVTQGDLFDESESEVTAGKRSDDLPEKLPYIVIVVDEVADIMATVGKEVEPAISRLTALSRAVGIHLILATQRPSVDVITGTIKSNIPGRIAFKVSQANDSRTILDSSGAEELIGRGDMLYLDQSAQLMRAQGAWVSDDEIKRVVDFIKKQCPALYDQDMVGRMERIKESDPDEALQDGSERGVGSDEGVDSAMEAMVDSAIGIIRDTGRATTTHLQRRLRIGYNRAADLMDELEERGIVGPQAGSAPREILVDLSAPDPLAGIAEQGDDPQSDEGVEQGSSESF